MADNSKIEWQLITAAKRIGISPDRYGKIISSGMKWCTGCRKFHPRGEFKKDSHRGDGLSAMCVAARKALYSRTYVKVPPHLRKPYGPSMQSPRDGDKQQARKTVNLLVRTGRLTAPKDLPCVNCGHSGSGRRHEYDHHMGYATENHLAVIVLCSRCHADRHIKEGTWGRRK